VLRLAVIALLLAPSHARAECKSTGLVPKAISPDNAVVPSDGGIVVAATPDPAGRIDPGDVAVQAGWRLRIGSDLVKPPVELLAPGLAIYRVAVANAFKVELVTSAGTIAATVKPSRSGGAALPAPAIKRAWLEHTASKRATTRVGVELAGPAPTGALALVIADAAGTPRSWTLATGATTLYPYLAEACRALPNGTLATSAGDSIVLFWVDAGGRVSPPSKPVAVGG
jgi:hypothetical protein